MQCNAYYIIKMIIDLKVYIYIVKHFFRMGDGRAWIILFWLNDSFANL